MEKLDPWPNSTTTDILMTSLSANITDLITTMTATNGSKSALNLSITPRMTSFPSTSRPATTSVSDLQLTSSEDSLFQGLQTLLTIIALGVNCVSLFVKYGLVSPLTAPLQLLTSLAFGNMLVPWAVMTLYFARSSCQDEIHASVLLTGHNAVALTLIVLAITHHIATFRPFQYERMTSRRRIWATITVIWILSLVLAHIQFLVSLRPSRPYCEQVAGNTFVAVLLSNILCYIACFISGLIYFRIMRHLRPVEAFLNPTGDSRLVSPRSTRGVVTGIILIAGYGIVWMPYFMIWLTPRLDWMTPRRSQIAVGVCQTLIVVNCVVNPVVYGWRMTCMRLGYSRLFQKCRACFSAIDSRCRLRLNRSDHGDMTPTTPLNHIDSVCY